jgi:hypothetical protein
VTAVAGVRTCVANAPEKLTRQHFSHALYRHITQHHKLPFMLLLNNPCLSSPPDNVCLQERCCTSYALFCHITQHHTLPLVLLLNNACLSSSPGHFCLQENPLLHFSHVLYRHITQHHNLKL